MCHVLFYIPSRIHFLFGLTMACAYAYCWHKNQAPISFILSSTSADKNWLDHKPVTIIPLIVFYWGGGWQFDEPSCDPTILPLSHKIHYKNCANSNISTLTKLVHLCPKFIYYENIYFINNLTILINICAFLWLWSNIRTNRLVLLALIHGIYLKHVDITYTVRGI